MYGLIHVAKDAATTLCGRKRNRNICVIGISAALDGNASVESICLKCWKGATK